MRRDSIEGVIAFTPERFGDDRGYFAEVYSKRVWTDLGLSVDFVQDNESLSAKTGTIRGMHFQVSPSEQGKLIRCQKGAILDVAVDIRDGSPTFGDHVAVRLDPDQGAQLWVPPGFAHGFCTLEPNTMIAYKVTCYYDPDADRGVRWDDPAFEIDWPVNSADALLSAKDRAAPTLHEFGTTAGLFS
jgi:dTDP-4-dehydrorhamnose 3,5-epimerase